MNQKLLEKAKKCDEIYLAGYPSYFGGADSEAKGLLELLRMYGIKVTAIPMFGCDQQMKREMDSIGVVTGAYRDNVFKNKHVIALCNGSFLDKLPVIMEQGRPKCVYWGNCMTWSFPKEVKAQSQGFIDYHLYVSDYQRNMIQNKISEDSGVLCNEFKGYRPYYQTKDEFTLDRPADHFATGRLSRNDPGKFSTDMWQLYDRILSKRAKKVFIQAWSDQVKHKVGEPPAGMDWMTSGPNHIPATEFYHKLHCIIHKTGGSRESYCRIVPECYAHGTIMIAENDYAFPDLIVDGETGFVCDTSDEMSFRASEIANYESERIRIAKNAYNYLVNELMNPDECVRPWIEVLS